MMRTLLLSLMCSSCFFTIDALRFPADSEAIKSCTDCPDMEWAEIPEGTFVMGDDQVARTSPSHSVTLPTFWMARAETTVGSYRACVVAEVCEEPGEWENCTWSQGDDDLPLNCITYDNAVEFAAWVGGRLPTEAEWEYAALSAGTQRRFPWGDADANCDMAVTEGCEEAPGPAKACSRPDGQTAQYLCDMVGNLREWTSDDYHLDYQGAPSDHSGWLAPINAGENDYSTPRPAKVVRDHGWINEAPNDVRWRIAVWPKHGHSSRGFRVVREAPP